MRITVWNCRGLGNDPAVRALLDLQRREDPDILFLSETKMEERRMSWLKYRLGMTNMVVWECEGRSGGLALMWKKHVNIELHNYSRYHIDVEIVEHDGFRWRFTGIYGEPATVKREKTWKLLRVLNQQLNLPWLCAGDFNEVLYSHEKKGGPIRAPHQMENFRLALADCGLRDLGYLGDKYTWRNNSHDANKYIKERLDRAVGNISWCNRFPSYQVIIGDPRHSDHRPVTILVQGSNRTMRHQGGSNGFRFEAKWLQEDGCEEIIKNAWDVASLRGESDLAQKLRRVAGDLRDWDSNVLGDLEKRIKTIKVDLEKVRRCPIDQYTVSREHFLREKLARLEEQQDMFWRQRAHVRWLQSGDKNTAFFHAFASERKKKNTIKRLRKEDGSWVEGEKQLTEHVGNYFFNLFTSTVGPNSEEMLQAVSPRVTEQMNESLCAEYTEGEVKAAMFNIGDLKAPGPDGMPAIFYKRFWHILGEQVTKEVLNVLRGGQMPEGWNDTMVVLIPKTSTPQNMKELRPISLCNVVYKVISKVITNRLKFILPDIIAPNQSAFVPGRIISDNILLVYELTHFLQKRRHGKVGYAAVKLDMSKAYDRVEWKFLKDIMLKMGFDNSWVSLVMKCVTTVRYQFKVNKELTDVIIPQRGLRQGDPLSPYLFLLCAEGFSAMLYEAERNGGLKGIKLCRDAPSVSHLLFADDSLLLFEANERNARTVRSILDTYEACSGQVINKDKSSILFSKNTEQRQKNEVKHIMHISSEGLKGRYLGMPSYIGRAKKRAFQYIKDKVWNRIQGWKVKLLSKAGKEILIKAAAQAIPVYTMSVFDLTKSLCDDLSSMICRFWWSQMDKTNKIHWVSWEKLSKPKRVGGLGFRDLYTFNKAMLAKQAWRLLQNPSSLCARVLAAKYHPGSTILEAKKNNGISYSWRSILKGVQILKQGLVWRVGNGRSINIWTDPWLPRDFPRKVITPRGTNVLSKVEELIDPVTNVWDTQLVHQTFNVEDAEMILQIPIHDQTNDFIAWHFDKKGMFSVKSAYQVAIRCAELGSPHGQHSGTSNNREATDFEWKKIWSLPLPNKVLHFLWRMATYSLPVRMKLKRRGMEVDTRCPVCYRFDEDGGHCFLKCKPVKKLWCLAQMEHIRSKLVLCNGSLALFEEIFRLTEEECVKELHESEDNPQASFHPKVVSSTMGRKFGARLKCSSCRSFSAIVRRQHISPDGMQSSHLRNGLRGAEASDL